jgi:hypothetical protein
MKEVAMACYRAYRLDDAGKTIACSEFEAAQDSEALEIVRVMPEELGFEVWCDTRMVGRFGRNDKPLPKVA